MHELENIVYDELRSNEIKRRKISDEKITMKNIIKRGPFLGTKSPTLGVSGPGSHIYFLRSLVPFFQCALDSLNKFEGGGMKN